MLERPVVVLTGAGISAESGVPTFRGPGGFWRRFRPEELATPEAFARDPLLVWEWYAWRREKVAACAPNAAHRALVEMELAAGQGWEVASAAIPGAAHTPEPARRPGMAREADGAPAPFTLITQNVDGLHEAAGSRNVLRLHGSIWRLRCPREGRTFEDRRVPLPELPPRCPGCGGLLRPDIVWFGEALDETILAAAYRAAVGARVMLVVGTSGLVQPAATLPRVAREAGARLVEFNPEETPLSVLADERRAGPATRELSAWWQANPFHPTGPHRVS